MTKVKYKVKARVNHLIVDGKRLGPGDVFEQDEEYYERNKIYVDPVFPERKLSEAADNPKEVDEEPPKVATTGRVVRPAGKEDKRK